MHSAGAMSSDSSERLSAGRSMAGTELDQDWPNREHSQLLMCAGMRWHVQICGTGPVMLLLHGTAASTHSFTHLLPLLSREFQVVALDLPGHAFSHAPAHYDYSMPAMATSIHALLTQLDLHPCVAVGHSAGAAVLCRMAVQQQLASPLIIAINGALQDFAGLPGQLFGPLARLLAGSRLLPQIIARRARDQRAVQRLLRGTGSAVDPAYADIYQRLFQQPQHVGAVLKMMANWNLHELEPMLTGLPGRLHLVVGDNDKAVPPAQSTALQHRLKQAAVDVSLQRLYGLGHLAHEEQPQQIADLIVQQARAAGLLA